MEEAHMIAIGQLYITLLPLSIMLKVPFVLDVSQSKLFPVIQIYWQRYQAKLLAKVKAICEGVSIPGDGRHDSMGHSAKFGAYTMFCCTIPMIIHFVLIQVQYI